MKEEYWKSFSFGKYEYRISSLGNVWSCKSHKILKQSISRGYHIVSLRDGHGNRKTFFIHKLVAEHFIPNPLGLHEVNHKDECKDNNTPNNLEWCTHKYNQNYGTLKQRVSAKNKNGVWSKPVLQYSLDGNFMAEFPSTGEVGRVLGFKSPGISLCCVGKKPQYMGYLWRYKINDNISKKIDGYCGYKGSGAPKSKPVSQYDAHGNKIGEYSSIESAGRTCHLAPTSISLCCRRKLKSCGGFIWRFNDGHAIEKLESPERSKLFSPVAKCGMGGQIIKKFISISDAVKATGVSSSCISDCCNGRMKTAGGCKWKFV